MAKGKGHEEERTAGRDNPYDAVDKKIDAVRKIRLDLRTRGSAEPASLDPVQLPNTGYPEPNAQDIYELFKETKHSTGDKVKDLNYISSTLSQIRKTEGGEKAGRGRGRNALTVESSEPSLADLLKVKDLAKEHGGVEALAKIVVAVASLADQMGGLERLHRSIDALRQLTQ